MLKWVSLSESAQSFTLVSPQWVDLPPLRGLLHLSYLVFHSQIWVGNQGSLGIGEKSLISETETKAKKKKEPRGAWELTIKAAERNSHHSSSNRVLWLADPQRMDGYSRTGRCNNGREKRNTLWNFKVWQQKEKINKRGGGEWRKSLRK